jgi:hypothetical protein
MSIGLVEVLTSAEKAWQRIQESEYARFAARSWYTKVAKIRQSSSRTEIVSWLLSNVVLTDQGVAGGNVKFDDLVEIYTEYTNRFAGNGLKLPRAKFEDIANGVIGGEGIQAGAEWSAQTGMYSAYWPQKQTADFMRNGETAIGYDGKALFATDHPVNPADVSKGVFSNLITDSTLTITKTKTPDQNLEALKGIASLVRKIKMPNGTDPRFLRVKDIIVGPNLAPTLQEVTQAKFLARYAGGGTSAGGSSDVSSVLTRAGFGEVTEADEFSLTNDDDASVYIVCEQASQSQLGALVYVDRQPFTTRYFTGMGGGTGADAELSRKEELEWHCSGRNTVGAGHPFLIFKVRPA